MKNHNIIISQEGRRGSVVNYGVKRANSLEGKIKRRPVIDANEIVADLANQVVSADSFYVEIKSEGRWDSQIEKSLGKFLRSQYYLSASKINFNDEHELKKNHYVIRLGVDKLITNLANEVADDLAGAMGTRSEIKGDFNLIPLMQEMPSIVEDQFYLTFINRLEEYGISGNFNITFDPSRDVKYIVDFSIMTRSGKTAGNMPNLYIPARYQEEVTELVDYVAGWINDGVMQKQITGLDHDYSDEAQNLARIVISNSLGYNGTLEVVSPKGHGTWYLAFDFEPYVEYVAPEIKLASDVAENQRYGIEKAVLTLDADARPQDYENVIGILGERAFQMYLNALSNDEPERVMDIITRIHDRKDSFATVYQSDIERMYQNAQTFFNGGAGMEAEIGILKGCKHF
jgi:hypothetical protein